MWKLNGASVSMGLVTTGFLCSRIRMVTTSKFTRIWSRFPLTLTARHRHGRVASRRLTATGSSILLFSLLPPSSHKRKAQRHRVKPMITTERDVVMAAKRDLLPFPELNASQRAAMLLLGRNWTQDIQAGRAHVCATYDPVHQALPSD